MKITLCQMFLFPPNPWQEIKECQLLHLTVQQKVSCSSVSIKVRFAKGPKLDFRKDLHDKNRSNITPDDSHEDSLQTTDQLQIHRNHDKATPPEPEVPVHTHISLPEISVLVSAESYASIELGVAKLEIVYQENLKCIAMTSNGWRCEETIHEDQLLKARELLSSSATSEAELDIELLPRLVLCPGHALGEIPRAYSERWTTFTDHRLPKEEAMSRFSADSWMSVQFFHNERTDKPSFPRILNRPRSTSNISAYLTDQYDFVGNGHAESGSLRRPIKTPQNPEQNLKQHESERHEFESSLPDTSPSSKFTRTRRSWDLSRGRPIFGKFPVIHSLVEY